MMELSGKRVLIMGLGESGLASARWCARQGAELRIVDSRAEPPGLAALTGRLPSAEFACQPLDERFDKTLLSAIDLLVLSPGLSPGLLPVLHARALGIPVVGEIELFAQALARLQPHAPIVAITGTNGKTTTTALTGHLIASTGRTVMVAGNISPAALDALMECLDRNALPQAWVLELSSFQLETTESLDATAATVLNVSDDHLDRYIDLEDYAAAKARIFRGGGVQVLNRDDARVRRMAIPGRPLITFGLDAPADERDFGLREQRGEPWLVEGERFLLPLFELPLAGLHNAANALAALALCAALGLDPASLVPALKSFRGLPHRVEPIAEIAGVRYYDDSKGTNVGATVAALAGLGRKCVVILGGEGKGQDFSPLMAAIARHARAAVLIGRDAPLIERAIAGCGVPVINAAGMDEAVRTAAELAQPGDAVLLSPACASFDMFKNYAHRAEVFRAAVAALEAER
ncbi:MAG: UDP-N-acetylmuramoyl-L-alanine--D-glutamate ligase [Rhodocyclaceae bacterium]|nr:UDP-N-acetylmuramoyl-L-alanine--D-glutamate ligase [Rhodocyclaceae bacterium]